MSIDEKLDAVQRRLADLIAGNGPKRILRTIGGLTIETTYPPEVTITRTGMLIVDPAKLLRTPEAQRHIRATIELSQRAMQETPASESGPDEQSAAVTIAVGAQGA